MSYGLSRSPRSAGRPLRSLPVLSLILLLLASTAWAHSEKPEKTGILLVAFGSSIAQAQVSFENIDAKVKAAHPGVPVRWAYTSHIIRTKLAKQGRELLSPAQALADMAAEGFTRVAVQSLHTIPGEEYEGLRQTVTAFGSFPDGIAHIELGAPLLLSTDDMRRAAVALLQSVPKERRKDEAVVFMGHGTPHPGNVYYIAMQQMLRERDPLALLGTVEGTPDLDQVRAELKRNHVRKAWLVPFMSVAGDHARNDMSGPEPDSWLNVLQGDGVSCVPVLKGTAEYDDVVAIWLDHLEDALHRLNGVAE